jgi:hypothetical protein
MFMKGYKNKYQGPQCRCSVSLSSETAPFGTSQNIVQLKQACHHVSYPPLPTPPPKFLELLRFNSSHKHLEEGEGW